MSAEKRFVKFNLTPLPTPRIILIRNSMKDDDAIAAFDGTHEEQGIPGPWDEELDEQGATC